MKRLLFALLAWVLLAACASSAPQLAATPATCGNLPKVYHPDRLQPVAGCVTFRGTVLANLLEQDGDRHLWIAPDGQYGGLLAQANRYKGRPAMVAEVVPRCSEPPLDEAAAARCPASKLPEPKAGDRVVLTGPLVEDRKHGYWREIHPVATLVVVG